jgi:hypothetical protein
MAKMTWAGVWYIGFEVKCSFMRASGGCAYYSAPEPQARTRATTQGKSLINTCPVYQILATLREEAIRLR